MSIIQKNNSLINKSFSHKVLYSNTQHVDAFAQSLEHKHLGNGYSAKRKLLIVMIKSNLHYYNNELIDKCDTKENNERALKEAGISLI